jgi:hypothetical protein
MEKEDDSDSTTKHSSGASVDEYGNHQLPSMPLHIARQTMTRADFIQKYDHDNLFTINSDGWVRADSVPMMRAIRDVCSQPGFDKFLEDTLERIGDIESLGRTREITLKDLWDGGKYKFMDGKRAIQMETVAKPTEDD